VANTMCRILLVAGIWPPDVGGPASHGPELGSFLTQCGHRVRVITTGPRRLDVGFPVKALRRDVSLPHRMIGGAAAIAWAAGDADVVYAIGMYTRSALGTALRRTPLVIKLVNDPAFERSRSLGLFSGSLEQFQESSEGWRTDAFKTFRRVALNQAASVVIPSHYLANFVRAWGVPEARIEVIPNSVPRIVPDESREDIRSRLGVDGPTLVFAGRFVRQKNVPLAVEAITRVPEARLVLVGEGPEIPKIQDAARRYRLHSRLRVIGSTSRRGVVEWLRAADAAVLPSDWENFPHFAVEALAAGTPVVATAVGGVPEIIESGVNGILVPAGDADALASAIQSLFADDRLRSTLRSGAEATGTRYAPERILGSIERILVEAAASS
jgi:glycosyltransferase involved in cell wall biosynthesis